MTDKELSVIIATTRSNATKSERARIIEDIEKMKGHWTNFPNALQRQDIIAIINK